jgi:hypothetical protein
MYVVMLTPIFFTITRAKNAAPALVSSVRVVNPAGVIANAYIDINTNPTASTTGTLTFSYTASVPGLYKFEILDIGNDLLIYSFSINVLSISNTFSTQITV